MFCVSFVEERNEFFPWSNAKLETLEMDLRQWAGEKDCILWNVISAQINGCGVFVNCSSGRLNYHTNLRTEKLTEIKKQQAEINHKQQIS